MYERGLIVVEAIKAYYNGSVFIPLVPVKVKLNQPVLITIMETANTKVSGNLVAEFFGALSAESYSEMVGALRDTERIDLNEW